jgi:hypothetical protein
MSRNEAFQVQDVNEVPQLVMRQHQGNVSGSFE